MHPHAHKLVRVLELLWSRPKQTRKHARQVPNIELVMEVHSSLAERLHDLSLHLQSTADQA